MSLSLGRRLLLAFYSALLWLLVPVTLYHLVWRGLLDRGVLIRQTGPAQWLRVTVGTPEENGMFRTALLEVLGRSGSDTTLNRDIEDGRP